MSKQTQYFLFPDKNLETSQIWKEAGFCPPMPIVNLIEKLHKSEECDIFLSEPFDEAVFRGLFEISTKNGEYHIYDITHLTAMARDCGISVKDRDFTSVAQDLTSAILQDYGVYLTKNSRDTDLQ